MIQVLDRAFEVLEFLSTAEGNGASLSRIEAATGIQKTTLSNILKTLEKGGYVAHPQKRKGYKLGYRLLMLAGPDSLFRKIEAIAQDEIKLLHDVFLETVVLAAEQDGRRVILKVMECQEGITARISHSSDLYLSATGRVILAHYPENRIRSIVARIGLPSPRNWDGIRSEEDLLRALAIIRKDGFCVSADHADIKGIAVPIIVGKLPVAAIGVCIPKFRCTTSKVTLIKHVLDECALSLQEKVAEANFID
ncbi:MAG: IclR family transcriptional regulator C-terminal domain-containing protein [Candidatus Cryptobacteroides sp.]|nr:IclR family transcriptional regulator C-terminal domain-containing protein [Candidatus Cryptobacteroides sp.]